MSETLIVSPMPSWSSEAIPTQDLILPLSPFPASVTPTCRGKTVPLSCIIAASSLYASVITTVLLALSETTTFMKPAQVHMSTHSMAARAIACGVLP